MAGCKDCEKCTRSFVGSLAAGAKIVATGGLSVLSAAAAAPFKRQCPQCGHGLEFHEAIKVQIAGLVAQQPAAPQVVVVQVAAPSAPEPARSRCEHCGASFAAAARCPDCGAAALAIPAAAPVAPAVAVHYPVAPAFAAQAPMPQAPAPTAAGRAIAFAKKHPKGTAIGVGVVLVMGIVGGKDREAEEKAAAASTSTPATEPAASSKAAEPAKPVEPPKPVGNRSRPCSLTSTAIGSE